MNIGDFVDVKIDCLAASDTAPSHVTPRISYTEV